ncbi:hypothetical protein H7J06_13350 [Mycobacterium hodleri]|uniref:hypothetical protein n=1 Tax=Mycolicibacterium hodleri TaxID=49897 RepID=UPI0021F30861|nr:hypothetical protein [Mycolicibacterium hodleri]MCV7133977.1 hypothetical protein [Mycolicibacterium hodleri]
MVDAKHVYFYGKSTGTAHIPLSGAVVERIVTQLEPLRYDRIYGNFNNSVNADAKALLRASADRHVAWIRGDFDHLT